MPDRPPGLTNTQTTFADIIEHPEALDTLTKTRRRDLIYVLRIMARFFHKEIDQVLANTEWLCQRLRLFHPRQAGVSEKHYANVKSAVIAAIKLAGVRNKRIHAFPNMSEAFRELYDAVPDRLLGYNLSRFFRYCSKRGREPADVTDTAVSEFEATLVSETLHKDPSKVAREAVLTWNKMKSVVAGYHADADIGSGSLDDTTRTVPEDIAVGRRCLVRSIGNVGSFR